MIHRVRQVFIGSARIEVGRTLQPTKSTFVVNANGALALHVSENIKHVFQQIDCKLSTSNNSSCINWNYKKVRVILILYTVCINRYLVKTLAEVLPTLHEVIHWKCKWKKTLSIEKWWLMRKTGLCTFPNNSSLAFCLSRNVRFFSESVRLCCRAISGLVTRVVKT